MSETREQLEIHRARLVHQNVALRQRNRYLHNRLRLLENAIRSAIVVGERVNMDALYQLRQRVPVKPRKKV